MNEFQLTAPPQDLSGQAEQEIAGVILRDSLGPVEVLELLDRIYTAEANRLNRTFVQSEMTPALVFQYQEAIRHLRGLARASRSALQALSNNTVPAALMRNDVFTFPLDLTDSQ